MSDKHSKYRKAAKAFLSIEPPNEAAEWFITASLTTERIAAVLMYADEQRAKDVCEWKCGPQPKYGSALIETSCRNRFDGSLHIAGMKYCPYCGRRIKEV